MKDPQTIQRELTVNPPEQAPADTGRPAEVDLQALAREIIVLLKEDLRLEKERSGRSGLSR